MTSNSPALVSAAFLFPAELKVFEEAVLFLPPSGQANCLPSPAASERTARTKTYLAQCSNLSLDLSFAVLCSFHLSNPHLIF